MPTPLNAHKHSMVGLTEKILPSTTPAFLWKGYSVRIDANVSIQHVEDYTTEGAIPEQASVFAITFFTSDSKLELYTTSLDILTEVVLDAIVENTFLELIEDIYISRMVRIKEAELKKKPRVYTH